LKKGDVNTRYFQVMANIRKQRNFIHSLQLDNGMAVTQAEKHQAVYEHYLKHIDSHVPRSCSLNLFDLHWKPRNLQHMDLPFTKHEIKDVVFSMPKEKTPGPDGYIGSFFINCWDIVREDLFRAVQ
jgi:hypothetical protein